MTVRDLLIADVDLKDHSRTNSPAQTHSPPKYVVTLHDGEPNPPVVLLFTGARIVSFDLPSANGKGD